MYRDPALDDIGPRPPSPCSLLRRQRSDDFIPDDLSNLSTQTFTFFTTLCAAIRQKMLAAEENPKGFR